MSLSPQVENLDVYAVESAGPAVLLAFDALDPGATMLLRSAARPDAGLQSLRHEPTPSSRW